MHISNQTAQVVAPLQKIHRNIKHASNLSQDSFMPVMWIKTFLLELS